MLLDKSNKESILFLIRTLGRGGAERQLVTLACAFSLKGIKVDVVYFYQDNAFEGELAEAGVRTYCLNKKNRWDIFSFARLFLLILREKPNYLHGYLSGPNILSIFIKVIYSDLNVAWGLRNSTLSSVKKDWVGNILKYLEIKLSNCVDVIIANSMAGKKCYESLGFPGEKIRVIPNGIDTLHFSRRREGSARMREEWGLEEGDVLIGIVARLDAVKGHGEFLRAAARVVASGAAVRFVCVGGGDAQYGSQLRLLAAELGLDSVLRWAGERQDVVDVYSALDVFVSASHSEGFSNSIAEAMSCEVPCIVTDVGDSSFIAGEIGMVVPPRDECALAEAMLRMAALPATERRALGARGRERIIANFGIEALVEKSREALFGKGRVE